MPVNIVWQSRHSVFLVVMIEIFGGGLTSYTYFVINMLTRSSTYAKSRSND